MTCMKIPGSFGWNCLANEEEYEVEDRWGLHERIVIPCSHSPKPSFAMQPIHVIDLIQKTQAKEKAVISSSKYDGLKWTRR